MAETTLDVRTTAQLDPREVVDIMRERVKVFVVEQTCYYQEVDDKDDEAVHVMLRENGEMVGYTRVIPHDDGEHISFGRVLVPKQYRGNGYGRQVVKATIDWIHANRKGESIKIQAQNYLRPFYESLGFKAVSDVYLEDNIPHLDMVMD
ncbi:GNAT family N-acetyltransferase [Bifidobacterium sp. ESL0763]|uniref:GNAT family N-acetyltransferase n=1 Tax=Bifidobacterium sp. ESL0763 TaxID=2983227 RepID=UPI0023F635D2|nr:GNAT family N-acetyltransferase [Bifidobacterium sp. ESL0763]MDF7663719.1 GNAT family N-acetyltransferase [Bifidobacterium sp. ESL0763]